MWCVQYANWKYIYLQGCLGTYKFDKDPINNERASVDVETSFPHYNLWEIFPVLKGA